MVVNKQSLSMQFVGMYSLHALCFVKNVVLSFWNININFSLQTLPREHCVERYINSMKFGYENQEAFYWENINVGDVLQVMPVVFFFFNDNACLQMGLSA